MFDNTLIAVNFKIISIDIFLYQMEDIKFSSSFPQLTDDMFNFDA